MRALQNNRLKIIFLHVGTYDLVGITGPCHQDNLWCLKIGLL